jgi:hypothetical protein
MLLKLVDKLEKYLLKLLEAAQVAHNLNRSQIVKDFVKESILKSKIYSKKYYQ